jgi:hypothetical protein
MCLAILSTGTIHAQTPQETRPTGRLGTQVDDVGLPSVGRVAFGFLLTVGLAVGAVVVLQRTGLLQRTWPAVFKRNVSAARIRPLDRRPVSATVTVHLIEVDGVRMVIAEGRGAMGLSVLPVDHSTASNASQTETNNL